MMVRLHLKSTLFPYTTLFRSVPLPDPKQKKERIILKGDLPSPLNPPNGCVFHTRCPYAMDICMQAEPEKKEMRSEEHTSELQSRGHLVCRVLLEIDTCFINRR